MGQHFNVLSDRIIRVVIYARYSCSNQTEQSIEGQLADCERFAEQCGFQIVGTYIDRALTATTDRRPQFQQMIKDSEKGTFDVIIVWKLDRFARNRYDSAMYKHKLKTNGVRVMSAMENIDDSPEGALMESVLEGFAEYFSRDLSQKVQRGMRETAKKHKITNCLPFGYCKSEQGTYAPDPNTSNAVCKIFDMYVSGIRKSDIAEWLNSNGYKTAFGNKFTVSSITPLIKNTRYIGKYYYAGDEYIDETQRIVTDDMFYKAQKKAAENQHGGSCKAMERYLLSKKLYCGYCQNKMLGECGKSKQGVAYHYYACMGRKKKHICTHKNARKHDIENYVMNSVYNLFNDEYAIDKILEMADNYQHNNSENINEIKELEYRISETNKKISNLLSAIEAGIFTATTKDRLQELEKIQQRLKQELIYKQKNTIKFSKNTLRQVLKNLDLSKEANKPEKQTLVDQLIHRIYLWEDKILIIFNFSILMGLNPDIDDADITAILKQISEPKNTGSDIKKYGTGTVTEPVQKSHKIKGFEQSINSINLKNKYY